MFVRGSSHFGDGRRHWWCSRHFRLLFNLILAGKFLGFILTPKFQTSNLSLLQEQLVKLENTRIEEQIRQTNYRISELESAKTSSDGEELKLIETRIDEQNLTKMRLQQEWKSKRTQALERLRRILGNGGCNPADRIMELQFMNNISESILTGEEISAEVALVDSTTNNIVEFGQESSARVEIVVLDGGVEDDLTGEAFRDKIVPEMEGRKPLLKGNVHVKLQRGKASVGKISFRHHTIKMKPSRFRLGARIANQIFDGVRIKEAVTETFNVKDFRNKYYRKHKNPLLSDNVSRLIYIRRRGKILKDLKDSKIETVEDFLIQLLINPERLKRIVNVGQKKKWEAIVNNARACQNNRKIYFYVNHEQKMGVAFNVLGEVLQLYPNNQHSPTAPFSESHQDLAQELLSSACIHWEAVRRFDDKNALEKYLTGLSMSDPLKLGYHGEMFGESRSRSNFSFQRISSGTSLTTETGDDDMIRSFPIDHMEILNDDFLQHSRQSSFNQDRLVSDFEDYLQECQNCNRLKRWRKILHVFRVCSIRKSSSSGR